MSKKFVGSIKKILIYICIVLVVLYLLRFLSVYIAKILSGGGVSVGLNDFLFFTRKTTFKSKVIFFLEIFLGFTYILTSDSLLGSIKSKVKTFTVAGDIVLPERAGHNEYGSARFLEKSEMDKYFDKVVLDNDLLGELIRLGQMDKENISKGVGSTYKQLTYEPLIKRGGIIVNYLKKGSKEIVHFIGSNKNLITIGQTRSGKARNILLQSIALQALAGENMVLNDPKGELYAYTVAFLKWLGYKVYAFDFREQLKSNCYNLLQNIIDFVDTGNIDEAINSTWDLVSQLVGEAKGEKIWNNGEASVIAAAIMCVVYDNKNTPEFRNLTNVYYFLFMMNKKDDKGVSKLDKYMETLPETHPAVGLLGISEVAPKRTAGSFYTSALTTLRLFISPNIYNMTKTSDFRLKDIADEKVAIFFIMPDEKTTYYPITSLMITQMYQELISVAFKNGGVLKRRWNFDVDEFGNFVKIPIMPNMVSASLARGIRLNLFIQSYAQLDKIYGKEDAATIKDNCEIKIYLQSGDNETKKLVSNELDKYTVSTRTSSLSKNTGSSSYGSSESTNLSGRNLLTPDELGRIKRPYHLVLSNTYPLVGHSPDLSDWYFNDIYSLGDIDFNRKVMMSRLNIRKEREYEEIKLWGIWNKDLKKKEGGNKGDEITKNITKAKTRL